MALDYELVVVPDEEEGGYVAYYPDLNGCITCAETIEEAKANAEDAKRAWLNACFEDGVSIPMPHPKS